VVASQVRFPPTHPELCKFFSPSAINDRLRGWRGTRPLAFWQEVMLGKQSIVTVVYLPPVLGIVSATFVGFKVLTPCYTIQEASRLLSKTWSHRACALQVVLTETGHSRLLESKILELRIFANVQYGTLAMNIIRLRELLPEHRGLSPSELPPSAHITPL
jgi:hypothetical protein